MIAFDSLSLPVVAGLLGRVTVVLALTWLGTRFAARRSASMRHALWVAAFLAVLALPLAARLVPALELPLLPAAPSSPAPDSRPAASRVAAPIDTVGAHAQPAAPVNLIQAPAVRAARSTATPEPASWLPSPLTAIGPLGWSLMTWLVIAAGLLLRYAYGLATVARITRRADEVHDSRWLDALDVAAATLGIVKTPRLLMSSDVAMPFTSGFLRATLVVPASAEDWTDERIDVVLRHELAHVARRDCSVQAMTQAALAIYWFHPLAWIGARHLRAERERACDDLVLATGTRGTTYAEHLLDIARAATLDTSPLAAAALAMARPSELEGRLLAILDPRRERGPAGRRRIVQVALAAVVVVVPLASVTLVARSAAPLAEIVSAPQPPISTTVGKAAETATATVTAQSTQVAVRSVAAQAVEKRWSVSLVQGLSTVVERGGQPDGVRGGVPGGISGGVPGGVGHGIGVGRGLGQSSDDERKPVSPAVVQALTEALKDSDAEVRKSAMQALARFRLPAAYDAFVLGLKDSDAEVRQQAAFALSQLRDSRATDPLIGALKDGDAEVRQQAAFALSQLREPRAVPALTAALKDPNDEVREQALFALSQIRDVSAVPALESALQDSQANVRQQAAFALSQIGDEHAVPALIAALKDKSAEVRQQAAFALSQIGDESAIDALTAALKDPAPEVRQQAIFALSQLAGGEARHRGRMPRAAIASGDSIAPPPPPPAPPRPVAQPAIAPAPRPR